MKINKMHHLPLFNIDIIIWAIFHWLLVQFASKARSTKIRFYINLRQTEKKKEPCVYLWIRERAIKSKTREPATSSHLYHESIRVLITWVTKHGYRPTEWTRPCLDSVGGWCITPVSLPFSKLNNHLTAAGVRSLASFCLREHRIKQVWSLYFTAAIGLCQEHITLSQKGSGLSVCSESTTQKLN